MARDDPLHGLPQYEISYCLRPIYIRPPKQYFPILTYWPNLVQNNSCPGRSCGRQPDLVRPDQAQNAVRIVGIHGEDVGGPPAGGSLTDFPSLHLNQETGRSPVHYQTAGEAIGIVRGPGRSGDGGARRFKRSLADGLD